MGAEVVDEARTFFEDGWIEEVLFPVKSGKEATVYCCRACPGRGEAYFALKAYRSRQDRNFRNAAIYQEGRVLGKARTMRAVRNKSRFGRVVEFGGWLHHEFAMLSTLHAAGAAVPRPVAVGARAILSNSLARMASRRHSSATCGYHPRWPRCCWSRRYAPSRLCSRAMWCTPISQPTTCSTQANGYM